MSNLTTKAIKKAFFELLTKKSIDQITIKDITSRCGVSRNTFYYHYEDLTALVEEIMMSMVDALIEKYPAVDSMDQGIAVAVKSSPLLCICVFSVVIFTPSLKPSI